MINPDYHQDEPELKRFDSSVDKHYFSVDQSLSVVDSCGDYNQDVDNNSPDSSGNEDMPFKILSSSLSLMCKKGFKKKSLFGAKLVLLISLHLLLVLVFQCVWFVCVYSHGL